jgi:hypothetical protein
MKKILLFDTSICTDNLGDYLIMEAIKSELRNIFPNDFFINIPTHDKVGKNSINKINISDFRFVCGTNLLSSNMNNYNQWKINIWYSRYISNVILIGVGWWQYQNSPNFYTRILLNRILNKKYLHSVRDNYTVDKLKAIGIKNVVNTGCPTLWNLNNKHCSLIPNRKSDNVLFTLTDYNKDYKRDLELIKILKNNYDKIYFWPQGLNDYEYLSTILKSYKNNIVYVSPDIEELDKLLSSEIKLDYVGTRLHAGIRAMQYKRRTIIVGIDNRAKELARDFNLPLIKREEINCLSDRINSIFKTIISLPTENINKWRNQFIQE